MVKFFWMKRVRHLLTIIFVEIFLKSYLWLLKKHKYFTQCLLLCSVDFYLTQLSNIIILAVQAKRLKAYSSIKQNSRNYNAVSVAWDCIFMCIKMLCSIFVQLGVATWGEEFPSLIGLFLLWSLCLYWFLVPSWCF